MKFKDPLNSLAIIVVKDLLIDPHFSAILRIAVHWVASCVLKSCVITRDWKCMSFSTITFTHTCVNAASGYPMTILLKMKLITWRYAQCRKDLLVNTVQRSWTPIRPSRITTWVMLRTHGVNALTALFELIYRKDCCPTTIGTSIRPSYSSGARTAGGAVRPLTEWIHTWISTTTVRVTSRLLFSMFHTMLYKLHSSS